MECNFCPAHGDPRRQRIAPAQTRAQGSPAGNGGRRLRREPAAPQPCRQVAGNREQSIRLVQGGIEDAVSYTHLTLPTKA